MFNSLVTFPASSSQWGTLQQEIFDAFRDFGFEIIGGDQKFPIYNCRYNEAKELILDLAVAGYSKERLSVELVDRDTLVVKGEGDTNISSDFFTIRNISNKSFTKSFRLSREVDIKSVTLENGILSVTMSVLGEKDNRKVFKPT